ncbi:MAG TPA: DUF2092 domain-containing protein [Chthonomonadaceae bacterium]|nr:DUF2092 domain-containing protein [Chthonomonadaceae bacterium]
MFVNAVIGSEVWMIRPPTVLRPGALRHWHGKGLFCSGKRLGALLLLGGMAALSAAPAKAQNARALLQKCVAAYQSLQSYTGSANVEVSYLYNGRPIQTQAMKVEMQVKRPNKLLLNFSSPAGSRLIVSDGANFTVYLPGVRQYNRYPTAPTLEAMLLPLLFARAGVQAGLDPLYFLSKNRLPDALGSLQLKASTTYNNKPVYVVTGVTHTKKVTLRDKKGRQAVLPPSTEYWTWWINKRTFLLEKIEAQNRDIRMNVPVRQGNKIMMRQYPVVRRLRHTVLLVTANPPLADKVFAFVPPKDATERKTVQELLHGSR